MNGSKSQAEPQVLKYKTNPNKECKGSEPELQHKTLPTSDWYTGRVVPNSTTNVEN